MGKTVRTIGASIVLVLVAIAAIMQSAPARPGDTLQDIAPTTTSTTISTSEAAPFDSFVYRVGLLAGVEARNYWGFYGESTGVWDAYVFGPTKPSLFTVHTPDATLQPEVATRSAEATEVDGKWHVEVPLHGGMAWSDGTPVTAHDVVFTFRVVDALSLGGGWAEAYPATISDIEATTPHLLTIRFTERPTLGTWPHAVGTAPIMPKHIWEPLIAGVDDPAGLYELEGVADVGGGPLAIEMITDDLVVSLANLGYVRGGSPDRVEYHIYGSETDALDALDLGLIDTVLTPRGLTPSDLEPISGAVTVLESPASGIRYLGFNLLREPMSTPAFRRALALLVERETHTYIDAPNSAWFDATRAEGLLDPYQPELGSRLALALEGLRGAGYLWDQEPVLSDDGMSPGLGLSIEGLIPARLTILTPGDAWDPLRPLYAARIASVLEWLGFDVITVETDFDTVVDLAFTPGEDGNFGYDMYLLGWSLGDPTLPGFYRTFFTVDSPVNNTGYDGADFLTHLDAYESAHDHGQARDSLWGMEEALSEDLPYLILYRASIIEVYRSDRVGYSISAAIGGIQGRLGGITDVHPVR